MPIYNRDSTTKLITCDQCDRKLVTINTVNIASIVIEVVAHTDDNNAHFTCGRCFEEIVNK